MSKIRINELARELEVKPNIILDMLPELGVADKKTHSSSLDDDVALKLRRRLAGVESEEASPRANGQPAAPSVAPRAAPVAATPLAAQPSSKSGTAPAAEPAAKEAGPVEPPPTPVRSAFPLRPPLATGQPAAPFVAHPAPTPSAPSIPSIPVSRGPVIAARTVPPPPKPGQIL